MEIDAISKRILVSGLDDWVRLFAVSAHAERVLGGEDEDENRKRSLAAIKQLLDLDLVTLGELGPDGFVPTSGPAEPVLSEVDTAWAEAEDPFDMLRDSAVWLRNTEKGNELAHTFAEQIHREDDVDE